MRSKLQANPSFPLTLLSSERGVVNTEFLMVALFFSLPVALALKELGPPLVALFEARVAWLGLPVP